MYKHRRLPLGDKTIIKVNHNCSNLCAIYIHICDLILHFLFACKVSNHLYIFRKEKQIMKEGF